jgi:hypothetical protein
MVVGGAIGAIGEGLSACSRIAVAGFNRFVTPILFCQPVVNTATAAKHRVGNWLERRAQQQDLKAAQASTPLACPLRESPMDERLTAFGERVRRRFNPISVTAKPNPEGVARPTAASKDPQP